jgi:hypothetical protein
VGSATAAVSFLGSWATGDLPFCFQRSQPRFGISDKLSQSGFGARVFRKPKNGPHPHDTVPKPGLFVFGFLGHGDRDRPSG